MVNWIKRVDFFCVDCDAHRQQKFHTEMADGTGLYVCEQCGCENCLTKEEGLEKNYNSYYNKGNDCDACKNQYLCGRDGDVTGCRRFDTGEECEFCEFIEAEE